MDIATENLVGGTDPVENGYASPTITQRPTSLAKLLGLADEAPQLPSSDLDTNIIDAKLGVACSLFRALRAKHAPTANHCLRVALRCSFFAARIDFDGDALDQLEIAALLHDIGKIGVPDCILTKPGPLTDEESEAMELQREIGIEILSASCVNKSVIDIVRLGVIPYSQRKSVKTHDGKNELPIGARILNISDAFDAMTTDHVYRPAMPRERAINELFEHAGAQFDPVLVREFANTSSQTEAEINQHISDRWFSDTRRDPKGPIWKLCQPLITDRQGSVSNSIFQQKLLDAMHDGVAFIDLSRHVLLWNKGAERLTGISSESVYAKQWMPSMLDMRDCDGNMIREENCPVQDVIRTGAQTLRRVSITNTSYRRISVDIHVIPVVDDRNRCYGATLLIHDASSETNLEERVQNLHEKATTDPLTGVANRAEFERIHQSLLESSLANGNPASIIICDVDRFKQINDVYGHQNGDEALINFASLLQRSCRHGDLVARYGGEEFVILCPGCDNATAARKAEEIRRELAQTPQDALHGKCMTASFGVTELQLGDTTETMIRRADRALYQAKDSGRNRVIQLGAGISRAEKQKKNVGWLAWMINHRKTASTLVSRTLVANVPISLLAEKIRGFIADHHAEIVTIEDDFIELHLHTQKLASDNSAAASRHLTLVLELHLQEQELECEEADRRRASRTKIEVSIKPKKHGDRRAGDHRAQQVLASLKSYLIAQEYRTD